MNPRPIFSPNTNSKTKRAKRMRNRPYSGFGARKPVLTPTKKSYRKSKARKRNKIAAVSRKRNR